MRNLLRSLPEPVLSAVEGIEMTAKETGYRKKLNALKKLNLKLYITAVLIFNCIVRVNSTGNKYAKSRKTKGLNGCA